MNPPILWFGNAPPLPLLHLGRLGWDEYLLAALGILAIIAIMMLGDNDEGEDEEE